MLSLSKTRRTKEHFLTRARSSTAACCGPLRCATLWSAGTRLRPGLRSHRTASDQRRAIGSAGERLVHTEEVTGSIPVSPTRSGPYADLSKDHRGSHSCSGPHDFFGEDPAGLLHGGQLEFLLGAEVRVQAARAHP